MGLDISHNCWHGAYSAFMRWRRELCKSAGLPPLDLMEGFYTPEDEHSIVTWARRGLRSEKGFEEISSSLPIRWDCLKPSSLHILLHHSDCEGDIPWQDCGPLANELEKLIPILPQTDAGGRIESWRDKTQSFIEGLRKAAFLKENVDFH